MITGAGSSEPVRLRPLTAADDELLRAATHMNVNWAGRERLSYRDLDTLPELAHYCRLRPERGDFGLVATRPGIGADDGADDGAAVGVVWLLFLPAADAGYGFVAADVPELSLCVWSGYRGRGLGRLLLSAALGEARERGIARVSLSTEDGNPSVVLYRALGFEPVPDSADGTFAVDL